VIPIKLIVAGVVTAVLLAAGATVWMHYTGLLEEINVLRENTAKLQTAVQLKDSQISSLEAQAASSKENMETVQADFAQARAQAERVKTLFANHKFDKLAKAKPGLISRKMQRATLKVFQEIEEIGNEVHN
jgi:predicted  nucleic acid-binding Zn-ribbon protein